MAEFARPACSRTRCSALRGSTSRIPSPCWTWRSMRWPRSSRRVSWCRRVPRRIGAGAQPRGRAGVRGLRDRSPGPLAGGLRGLSGARRGRGSAALKIARDDRPGVAALLANEARVLRSPRRRRQPRAARPWHRARAGPTSRWNGATACPSPSPRSRREPRRDRRRLHDLVSRMLDAYGRLHRHGRPSRRHPSRQLPGARRRPCRASWISAMRARSTPAGRSIRCAPASRSSTIRRWPTRCWPAGCRRRRRRRRSSSRSPSWPICC